MVPQQVYMEHNAEVPLGPIFTANAEPTYEITRFFVKQYRYTLDSRKHTSRIQHTTPNDVLDSFDVVSLLTIVPINKTMYSLKDCFQVEMLNSLRNCFTMT